MAAATARCAHSDMSALKCILKRLWLILGPSIVISRIGMGGAHALHARGGKGLSILRLHGPCVAPEVICNALLCSMMRFLPNLMPPCCRFLPDKHAAHTRIPRIEYLGGRLLPQMWICTKCQRDRGPWGNIQFV